jgi:hypothetical protein
MEVPNKIKIDLSYDPVIPLLGHYWAYTHRNVSHYTPMFIIALYTIGKL